MNSSGRVFVKFALGAIPRPGSAPSPLTRTSQDVWPSSLTPALVPTVKSKPISQSRPRCYKRAAASSRRVPSEESIPRRHRLAELLESRLLRRPSHRRLRARVRRPGCDAARELRECGARAVKPGGSPRRLTPTPAPRLWLPSRLRSRRNTPGNQKHGSERGRWGRVVAG